MASTPNSNTSSPGSLKLPNLTSLSKQLLLEVMSLLDAPSLKHLRLTNKLLSATADEIVTFIKYGTARDCCSPGQLESEAKRWPSIKIIKLSFLKDFFKLVQADPEEITNAMQCLVRANWTNIEEIELSATFYGRPNLNISGAQALAACTVSWGRLRKLTMQAIVCDLGLNVLATHGNFPSLEELDLNSSDFRSNKHLAGAALAKLVSRAPKLCKLTLESCQLGEHLISLFQMELSELKIINLGHSGINNKLLSILDPGRWPGLSSLVLEGNLFSANGLGTMLKKDWSILEHLDLSSTAIGYEGMQCLIAATSAGRLPSLTSLGVRGFAGMRFEFFSHYNWRQLESLELGGEHFDQEEMLNFIVALRTQHFPALKSLTLGHCEVHEDSWNAPSTFYTWNHLEELKLDRCRMTPLSFANFVEFGIRSFRELRLLQINELKGVYGMNLNGHVWTQALEQLFYERSWPSLMTVEFTHAKMLPKQLSGWKIMEMDDGEKTVMERI